MSQSVSLSTVQNWEKDVDSLREWLRYDQSGGKVTRIFCELCHKHRDRLREIRNFNSAFIDGVTGSALKKDNVAKHKKSDMHSKAVNMERMPARTITSIMKSTPLGKAYASANSEETGRVSKLFKVAHMLAKEELPFAKYPAIVELEERQGVSLGNTYLTEHKCQEFANIVGDCMADDTRDEISGSRYLTVLLDGSTDSSVMEKELLYVMYVGVDGSPQCTLLCLADVQDATAVCIKALLTRKLQEIGIDLGEKLVSICVDGAAVNLGVRRGLSALLKQDMPWLTAVHCMNHRLELAAKDACATSYLDEISTLLVNLHYTYEKSPKRLRELKAVADEMEEGIRKPDKANGTRWLQHKSRALSTLLQGYPVIVEHLRNMCSDQSSVKPVDKIKFRTYLNKLTSFKFILHSLFYEALLNPLASFSCSLQADSVDLCFSVAKLKALFPSLEKLKEDLPDATTELAKFFSSVDLEG